MGFKSLIKNQVKGAMRILGTDADGLAPATFSYNRPTGTSYDPATRRTTETLFTASGIPITMVRFKIDDMDAEVRPKTDRRALIAALDLEAYDLVPSPEDFIIDLTDNTKWSVVRLMSDPAAALHILHLRKV